MLIALFGAASAQYPIQTRNHRAFSLLFLRFEPVAAALAVGEKCLTFQYVNANEFKLMPEKGGSELLEDYEISRIAFQYRQAISVTEEWFAGAQLIDRGGGFLDEIIQWWHDNILRWNESDRADYPTGKSRIAVFGKYEYGSGIGLGDLSLGYRKNLSKGTVFRAAIELPIGSQSNLIGSGGVDFGVSVDKNWKIKDTLYMHGQLALVFQGNEGDLRNKSRLVDHQTIAVIWKNNSRDEWILQWQSERAPVGTNVRGADFPHRLLTFGYRRKLSQYRFMEVYLSEDADLFEGNAPLLANIGPDLTFGISFSIRL